MFCTLLLVIVTFIGTTFCAPMLENVDDNVPQNLLEEQSEFFEGDMILTPDQERAIMEAKDARNGLRDGAKRWPNRTVVYYIDEEDFDEDQVKMIEDGMSDIANKSCLKFEPRKSKDEHSVTIQGSGKGCYSNVGYNSGDDEDKQVLNLAKGCFKHGTVVHEMLHTLGFYHMQSTYDRDDFVEIIWENISPGHEHNFAKYNNDTVTDFGVKYDYDSVMHYPEKAFSKNGEKTIIPLQENATIGQRRGLSDDDIVKLNIMYCELYQEEVMKKPGLLAAFLSWKDKLFQLFSN